MHRTQNVTHTVPMFWYKGNTGGEAAFCHGLLAMTEQFCLSVLI